VLSVVWRIHGDTLYLNVIWQNVFVLELWAWSIHSNQCIKRILSPLLKLGNQWLNSVPEIEEDLN
jgi:hypothetical protein